MSKDKNYGEEIDLKKYQGENNVSLRNMNIGLWLSEKRTLFIRLLIIFLILLSAWFFIYSAYQYFTYFVGVPKEAPAADNNLVSPRNLITDLKIDPPQVFKNGDKYDLTVKISNANDKFSANFDACFNLGDQELGCTKSFILPSESKYIFVLGKDIKADLKTLTYSTKNIAWQRVDAHTIPSWSDFLANRLNFSFTDISFYSINDNDYLGQSNGNILEFNVQNLSAYGYYEAPLNIALFEGSQLVSVNTYVLQNLVSGEKRNIKINWPGNYSNVRVEIIPDINILNDGVYLKYQGPAQS
ncbi:MAG: hypothetical protein ACYC40_02970 [Patescibacteria group bacterium]